MVTNRGAQCSESEHGTCDACPAFITRHSEHVHVYARGGRHQSKLCGKCYAIIIFAAEPIIRVAEAAGLAADPRTLRDALQRGELFAGRYVQADLPN